MKLNLYNFFIIIVASASSLSAAWNPLYPIRLFDEKAYSSEIHGIVLDQQGVPLDTLELSVTIHYPWINPTFTLFSK